MNVRISVEPSYLKGLARLPPDRQKAANQALVKFQAAPELPGLRFRPLKGKQDYYILSCGTGDRIILRRDGPDLYAAVDVGVHDIYRKYDR